MFRFRAGFFILALLHPLLLALPALGEENLLVNGDFSHWSDDGLTGWTLGEAAREGEGPPSLISRLATGPDGKPAVRLSGDIDTRVWWSLEQHFSVEPGDLLELSGWLRVTGVKRDKHRYANCLFGLIAYSAEGERVDYKVAGQGEGDSDWTFGRQIFLAPPGTASVMVICFISMSGMADFADLRLIKEPTPVADPDLPRAERWRQDLDYFAKYMPRLHVAPWLHCEESEFRAAVAELRGKIDVYDDLRMGMEFKRLMAMLRDVNSTAFAGIRPDRLPIRLRMIGEEMWVVGEAVEELDCLGARLLAMDGIPLATLRERVAPYISHETTGWLDSTLPSWLEMPQLAHGIGLIESGSSASFELELAGGGRRTLTLTLPEPKALMNWRWIGEGADQEPLYSQKQAYPYWFEYLPEERALYFRYSRCKDLGARPFADFSKQLLAVVDSLPVSRFILDLRRNGGGNSTLLNPLIEAVARRAGKGIIGRCYVITDRRTLSAAALNAIDFRRSTGAIVAGETMGNRLNHCGEERGFPLPNSGVQIAYSSKHFIRVAKAGDELLEPDLPVALTLDDLRLGRDPVLAAVLEHDP